MCSDWHVSHIWDIQGCAEPIVKLIGHFGFALVSPQVSAWLLWCCVEAELLYLFAVIVRSLCALVG